MSLEIKKDFIKSVVKDLVNTARLSGQEANKKLDLLSGILMTAAFSAIGLTLTSSNLESYSNIDAIIGAIILLGLSIMLGMYQYYTDFKFFSEQQDHYGNAAARLNVWIATSDHSIQEEVKEDFIKITNMGKQSNTLPLLLQFLLVVLGVFTAVVERFLQVSF